MDRICRSLDLRLIDLDEHFSDGFTTEYYLAVDTIDPDAPASVAIYRLDEDGLPDRYKPLTTPVTCDYDLAATFAETLHHECQFALPVEDTYPTDGLKGTGPENVARLLELKTQLIAAKIAA